MTACHDQALLLGGLVDGELDAANVAMVEAHVARCEDCREEVDRLRALRNLLGSESVRHSAPEALRQRLAGLPDFQERPMARKWLPGWLAPGIIGALAASLALLAFLPSGSQPVIDEEIVSSHVRSLQPGHLTDVLTTNQHVVKPWFNGRIDYSPPVVELADRGFPLAGGRLDSLDGRTVAAIVYHRRLHTVNLFVWPAKDAAKRSFVKDGFAVTEWSRNGLRFAAVSDIPPGELRQFGDLFASRSS